MRLQSSNTCFKSNCERKVFKYALTPAGSVGLCKRCYKEHLEESKAKRIRAKKIGAKFVFYEDE